MHKHERKQKTTPSKINKGIKKSYEQQRSKKMQTERSEKLPLPKNKMKERVPLNSPPKQINS